MCVIENNRTWAYIPHCCGIERFELHTFYIKFSFFFNWFWYDWNVKFHFCFHILKKKKTFIIQMHTIISSEFK